MSKNDLDIPTRHAKIASKTAGLILDPRSTDSETFLRELQDRVTATHEELFEARATLLQKAPKLAFNGFGIRVSLWNPSTTNWPEFFTIPFLSRLIFLWPATLRQLYTIKVHGRARLVEKLNVEIFDEVAMDEARKVAAGHAKAPPGWATLVERDQIRQAAAPPARHGKGSRI